MSLDLDKIRRSVGIIGESDSIQEMLSTIGQVANTNILVSVSYTHLTLPTSDLV